MEKIAIKEYCVTETCWGGGCGKIPDRNISIPITLRINEIINSIQRKHSNTNKNNIYFVLPRRYTFYVKKNTNTLKIR